MISIYFQAQLCGKVQNPSRLDIMIDSEVYPSHIPGRKFKMEVQDFKLTVTVTP
jgi:hypothetical protein